MSGTDTTVDPSSTWVARVWADRDYHELVLARQGGDGASVGFPPSFEPREVVLRRDEVRIGRSGSGDATGFLEIDLSGPPLDPGVSHLHVVLLALPPDRWVVLDAGSTNGTTINYDQDALTADIPVPLNPGDRIHVGAWTTITIDRR